MGLRSAIHAGFFAGQPCWLPPSPDAVGDRPPYRVPIPSASMVSIARARNEAICAREVASSAQ